MSLEALEVAKSWGMLTAREVHAICFMAKIMPEKAMCVNIGAGTGTSSMAFIETRPDLAATFWTIDNTIESPFGGLQNETNAFAKTSLPRPHQVLHDSQTVDYPKCTQIEKPVFDYVFIDGNHSFDGCTKDFYNIYPYCKEGTIVAFHDYNNPDKNCVGVKPAVDAIMKDTKSPILLHVDLLLAIRIGRIK